MVVMVVATIGGDVCSALALCGVAREHLPQAASRPFMSGRGAAGL